MHSRYYCRKHYYIDFITVPVLQYYDDALEDVYMIPWLTDMLRHILILINDYNTVKVNMSPILRL